MKRWTYKAGDRLASGGIAKGPRQRKHKSAFSVGDRVYAAESLWRTGLLVNENERGTIEEIGGRGDRYKIQWDGGLTGWVDEDVIRS